MDGTTKIQPSSNGYGITWHADFRWVQRAHEFNCRLHRAWSRAEDVQLHSNDFDRVRHDAETGTLLCVRNGELVTVLVAAYEQYESSQSESVNHQRAGGTGTTTNQRTTAALAEGDD